VRNLDNSGSTFDIHGGIRSGIDTCWYNPAKIRNNIEIVPKYELNNLLEIIKIFSGN
jgi:2-haloacid dehalogenase